MTAPVTSGRPLPHSSSGKWRRRCPERTGWARSCTRLMAGPWKPESSKSPVFRATGSTTSPKRSTRGARTANQPLHWGCAICRARAAAGGPPVGAGGRNRPPYARLAEPLHDTARALIGGNRQGNDLAQPDLAKAVIERGLGGLGRVTSAPIGSDEAPGDLHRRGEVGVIGDRLETDDADKASFAGELDDPLPKTVLFPMGALPSHPGIRRQPTLRQRQQVFHNDWIGGHFCEVCDILVAPRTQHQLRGPERDGHGYFLLPPAPPIRERNISCSCSNPLRVAGSQVFSIASGSIALMFARSRSCTSLSSSSCSGFNCGSPKNSRTSSGVQSMSNLIFIATSLPRDRRVSR